LKPRIAGEVAFPHRTFFLVQRIVGHHNAADAGDIEYVIDVFSEWLRIEKLARFFQVTAIFLLVFVVQLFIYGFHELAEAHVLPNSEALHWATEPYGPDGRYGQILSYALLALPLGWLVFAALFGGKRTTAPPAMHQTATR